MSVLPIDRRKEEEITRLHNAIRHGRTLWPRRLDGHEARNGIAALSERANRKEESGD
jgi:hypothetical protein